MPEENVVNVVKENTYKKVLNFILILLVLLTICLVIKKYLGVVIAWLFVVLCVIVMSIKSFIKNARKPRKEFIKYCQFSTCKLVCFIFAFIVAVFVCVVTYDEYFSNDAKYMQNEIELLCNDEFFELIDVGLDSDFCRINYLTLGKTSNISASMGFRLICFMADIAHILANYYDTGEIVLYNSAPKLEVYTGSNDIIKNYYDIFSVESFELIQKMAYGDDGNVLEGFRNSISVYVESIARTIAVVQIILRLGMFVFPFVLDCIMRLIALLVLRQPVIKSNMEKWLI